MTVVLTISPLFTVQVEGPSRGSYGLNVARLAGIPDRVLALATQNAAWMRAARGDGVVDTAINVNADASAVGAKRKLLEVVGIL